MQQKYLFVDNDPLTSTEALTPGESQRLSHMIDLLIQIGKMARRLNHVYIADLIELRVDEGIRLQDR